MNKRVLVILAIQCVGAMTQNNVEKMEKTGRERQVRIRLSAEADETLQEGVFLSMAFTPKYYADAKIKASGKKVTLKIVISTWHFAYLSTFLASIHHKYVHIVPQRRRNPSICRNFALTCAIQTATQDK